MSGRTLGHLAATLAFVVWGFFPLFFKRLDALPPGEILAWRIVCAFATLVPLMLLVPGPRVVARRLGALRRWWPVPVATVLIAVNWLVFIHAVTSEQVLEGSLGYFLTPTVNSLLGVLFFGERPDRWRLAAIAVAALGMLAAFVVAGAAPAIPIALALTWGLYGAMRKTVELDSATGLLVECALLAPLAVGYLLLAGTPPSALDRDTLVWLSLSGALTLLPLYAVVVGARRIEMGTLGMFQYITPTLQLGFAVTLFGETLDPGRGVALGATLAAVALWLVGARRR